MRAGGESGPAVVPNKPDESLLISALRYQSNEMPPSGKLPDAVINDFVKWISLGAPDPRTEATPMAEKNQKATRRPIRAITGRSSVRSAPRRQTLRTRPPLAPTSIDSYSHAWKRKAFRRRPKLRRGHCMRRLYYDLIGLPPTAEELDDFAADPSDARYEAAVDRLLASPRFGERWARHWLDIARYADTKGYVFEEDRNYKQAYTYRDWVIASFNADRPFDKFIVAQIAADQIDDKTCAPATGFLTLGRRFLNVQPDIINDRIDVVSRGLMGLTVACARCHDHKYDPISAADYYALYGVFASANEKPRDDAPPQLVDADKPYDPVVFLRGDPGNPGPKVDRRFLTMPVARQQAGAVPTRQRPPRNGRGHRQPRQSAHGPRLGEPRVGTSVWQWHRRHAERFRRSRQSADASRTARFAGLRTNGRRLVDQATHSPARLVRHVPAIEPDACRVRRGRSGKQIVWRANRRRLDLESLRDSLIAVGRAPRRENGRPVRLADRRAVLHTPLGLRFHRTPKPARVLPHVRFCKPKHAHARAAANHRPATSAVSHEQPVRHRASDVPRRAQRTTGVAGVEPQASPQTRAQPPTASAASTASSASPSAANPRSTN